MSERLSVQEIAKRAMSSIGLPVPSSIVNENDDTARQLVACLYEVVSDMLMHGDWQALRKEGAFTTVAGENQGNIYAKFTDWRRFVDGTVWNVSQLRPLSGPLNPQDWREAKATGIGAADSLFFRVSSDNFYILGQTAAGENIELEYISANWLASSNGLDRYAMIKKTSDICLLPHDAMIAGVQWRYLFKNGQDSTASLADYEKLRAARAGEDGGKRTLSMVPRRRLFSSRHGNFRVVGYE